MLTSNHAHNRKTTERKINPASLKNLELGAAARYRGKVRVTLTIWEQRDFVRLGEKGAVESLIRQVVNLRLKGNSKFWLQNNAEIMLHQRSQWIAKSWDSFCDSIFNSFIKPQTA